MHFVGNDYDRLAVIPHIAKDCEQLVRLLRSQDGRRFVQDQNVRPPVEHLDDLNRLLLGNRHVIDLLVRIHFKSIRAADFPDPVRRSPEVILPVVQAENDIFRRGHDIHELEMLMDHADPVLKCLPRGIDGSLPVIDIDRSAVRIIDTRQHIHQCRLAAAVFTKQCKYFSPVYVQVHVDIGPDRAKSL